jgi:uncharacterized protein YjbI with pentapeptide repeats
VSWTPTAPDPATVLDKFRACEDEEDLEVLDTRYAGATSTEAVVLDRPEVVNVVLEGCDLTGVLGRSGRANRVEVRDSRLRAVTWVDGIVQDVVFDTVTAADLSFRFSTLRRVVFRDCTLPGLDLTDVTFDNVRFERCDLSRAVFDRAKVKALRLEGCQLVGLTGADSLSGASVHPDDLLELGPSLATALGITVE